VPFNAVDGAIDALAAVLSDWDIEVHLGQPLANAARAFPVLARGGAPKRGAALAPVRTAAFDGVIEAIAAVATYNGVLLLIDDLQWADEDALALLSRVLEVQPPGVAVIAASRDDVGEGPGQAWIRQRAHQLELRRVGPLDENATLSIVRATAVAAGKHPPPHVVRAAATECGGSPFLAELAGRALALHDAPVPSLGAYVGSQVRAVPHVSQSLLALLFAANEWTSISSLPELLGCKRWEVENAVSELEREGLIRRARAADKNASVDLYHDLVRAAVSDSLDAPTLRRAHAALLVPLLALENVEPHRVVRHLLGAGRLREAGERAVVAAARAEETLAYGLAADMYDVALRHLGGDRLPLVRSRATNLERAGRYAECAACWSEIALAVDDPKARGDALAREVSALYSANEAVEARRKLPGALAALGRPLRNLGGLGALLDMARFAIGPAWWRKASAGHQAPDEISETALRDLPLVFAAFVADQRTGLRLMLHLRDALDREGDANGAAGCDSVLAGTAMQIERRGGIVPRAERYLRAAAQRLADRPRDRLDHEAALLIPYALRAQRLGQWADAAAMHDRVTELVERYGMQGTMTHRIGLVGRFSSAVWSQNVEATKSAWKPLEAELRKTNNYWLWAWEAVFTRKLYAADPGTDDLARWSASAPHGFGPRQHIEYEIAAAIPQWIRGDVCGAARRLRLAFRAHLRFRTTMFTGVYASLTALAEATALQAGDREASPRLVLRCARLASQAPPWATTRALRALAYLAEARGRPERALQELERAEAEAARHGQRIDAAIARYQRGKRLGGDRGLALQSESRAAMEALGLEGTSLEEPPSRIAG
jgi:hypothetical protein